jgi:hypothetical protein
MNDVVVEQKNGAIVRRLVGYGRFEGVETAQSLARPYAAARLYLNFFQPSFKLREKRFEGAKIIKRYHAPATPCERALAHPSFEKAINTSCARRTATWIRLHCSHRYGKPKPGWARAWIGARRAAAGRHRRPAVQLRGCDIARNPVAGGRLPRSPVKAGIALARQRRSGRSAEEAVVGPIS